LDTRELPADEKQAYSSPEVIITYAIGEILEDARVSTGASTPPP
jgi:hypothetical protein